MSTLDFDAPISPLTGLGIVVLAISTSAILVHWSAMPSLVEMFYQVLFTVTLLAPVMFVRYHGALVIIPGWDLLAVEGAGITPAAHFASQFENPDHTMVAVSVTLVRSQPFFAAVGVWAVLDERMSHRIAVGIGVALAGMALMSVSDFPTAGGVPRPFFGNGLAVVGTVTAVAYVLIGWGVRSRVSLVPYVVVVYSICAAALLVVAIGRGDPLTGYPPREWLLFLGMTVGPDVFGHTATNWALAHLEPSVVFVSLLGEPVGSTILALFLLGEIPTLSTVFGGAVALGGIYISTS